MATHRTQIAEAFCEIIKEKLSGLDSTYYTNIYNNCSTKILHFDQINDYPFISVVKSMETPEYHPGGFRWIFLDMYLRIYVRGLEDYDEQVEKIMSDLISLIDREEEFEYTIINPDGSTTVHSVTEILWLSSGTDEGLLAPDAMGEIKLRVRYDDHNVGLHY